MQGGPGASALPMKRLDLLGFLLAPSLCPLFSPSSRLELRGLCRCGGARGSAPQRCGHNGERKAERPADGRSGVLRVAIPSLQPHRCSRSCRSAPGCGAAEAARARSPRSPRCLRASRRTRSPDHRGPWSLLQEPLCRQTGGVGRWNAETFRRASLRSERTRKSLGCIPNVLEDPHPQRRKGTKRKEGRC